jgi:hypothetical protein
MRNDVTRLDQLQLAVALGDELLRITDCLPGSLAGPHVSLGVELLRAELAAAEPLSTLPGKVAAPRLPEA